MSGRFVSTSRVDHVQGYGARSMRAQGQIGTTGPVIAGWCPAGPVVGWSVAQVIVGIHNQGCRLTIGLVSIFNALRVLLSVLLFPLAPGW